MRGADPWAAKTLAISSWLHVHVHAHVHTVDTDNARAQKYWFGLRGRTDVLT